MLSKRCRQKRLAPPFFSHFIKIGNHNGRFADLRSLIVKSLQRCRSQGVNRKRIALYEPKVDGSLQLRSCGGFMRVNDLWLEWPTLSEFRGAHLRQNSLRRQALSLSLNVPSGGVGYPLTFRVATTGGMLAHLWEGQR